MGGTSLKFSSTSLELSSSSPSRAGPDLIVNFEGSNVIIKATFFPGRLEAQPRPGLAFWIAGLPAGFAGRAKPAPGPSSLLRVDGRDNREVQLFPLKGADCRGRRVQKHAKMGAFRIVHNFTQQNLITIIIII